MRAIIVDDEQIMLRSFMRLSKGISNLNVIAQFENPEEALLFVQENAVELAFLDIKMPGMNGIELAVKIREICPSILIVFISARTNTRQRYPDDRILFLLKNRLLFFFQHKFPLLFVCICKHLLSSQSYSTPLTSIFLSF